jgi:Do/DeqQ family serine protease
MKMNYRCALWLILAAMAQSAVAAVPSGLVDGERMPSLAPMLARVTPSVVNIATFTNVRVRNPLLDDPFFRRFFDLPEAGQRYRRTQSAGSGVIVDPRRGYIVTNNHVVDRSDEITVTLADGRTLDATLVGSDTQVDLSVLKVDPEGLVGIALADSHELQVGDFVVAIGNPFGLGQTVTSGIVSALGRSGLGIEGYEDFIQTDASINPGNSGGALVNLRGELVGINTAIFSRSGGNIGIGFAIPSNIVQVIMDQLIRYGEVRRGHVGLEVQELNVELAEAFGLDRSQGVVVVRVDPDSAADHAGLRPGDVIVQIGDRKVARAVDYYSQAAVLMVGDEVPVSLIRDGKREKLVLAIGATSFEKVAGGKIHRRLSGTLLQNYRSDEDIEVGAGVQILEVQSGSYAYYYGLRSGDIIVAANRQPVHNLADLTDSIERSPRRVELRVFRDGRYYDALLR